MSNSVVINTALRLPAPDIEALLQGRVIAAMPRQFITPRRQFALYPANASINVLPVERYYHSGFLSLARTILAARDAETVTIKGLARWDLCQVLNDVESLAGLSALTIWTTEALQETLTQQQNIFLTYLRVYQLSEPIEVPVKSNSLFVALPQPLTVSDALPVLRDRIFTQRRRQLEKPEKPLHPELEELESAIAQLALSNPAAESLNHHV